MESHDTPPPEYSYLLPLDTIGVAEKRLTLSAGEAERAALAKRFELVSLDSFSAELVVRRIHGAPLVLAEGMFSADVVQSCVVTDEPVPAHIEEQVAIKFGPEENIDAEVEFDPNAEDPPEPFIGNAIELGEWLTQCLGISIDPYPRAAGVVLEYDASDSDVPETGMHRPFEALLSRRKDQP